MLDQDDKGPTGEPLENNNDIINIDALDSTGDEIPTEIEDKTTPSPPEPASDDPARSRAGISSGQPPLEDAPPPPEGA